MFTHLAKSFAIARREKEIFVSEFPTLRCKTVFNVPAEAASNMVRRSLKESTVQCLDDGRFYRWGWLSLCTAGKLIERIILRNPERDLKKTWSNFECSKYYLCLDGEVFEFKCSAGLLFDVSRQICDFKANVENCDLTAETKVPKPLLHQAPCANSAQLGCADGICLPNEYFCDGWVVTTAHAIRKFSFSPCAGRLIAPTDQMRATATQMLTQMPPIHATLRCVNCRNVSARKTPPTYRATWSRSTHRKWLFCPSTTPSTLRTFNSTTRKSSRQTARTQTVVR